MLMYFHPMEMLIFESNACVLFAYATSYLLYKKAKNDILHETLNKYGLYTWNSNNNKLTVHHLDEIEDVNILCQSQQFQV